MISKTNLFILIATALLGVLLIVVLGIFEEVIEPPPATTAPAMVPAEPARQDLNPAQPDIFVAGSLGDTPLVNGRDDLIATLDDLGLDGAALVFLAADWYRERGYPPTSPLLNLEGDEDAVRYYDGLDDETLISMADAGDVDAMQSLAARNLLFDPIVAIDWYKRAASHGSLYAIMQVASLYDTFSNTALDAFNTDEYYLSRLSELREGSPSLGEDALAWSLAAIGAGGEPAVQDGVAEWVNRMTDGMDPATIQRACRQSERNLLELAADGRARGSIALSGQPPAIFISRPATSALPCDDDIRPLVDTSLCVPHTIVDARRGEALLYVCMS